MRLNGISALVSQTSFLGQTSGGVARWLFSQATHYSYENHCNDHKVTQELIIQQIPLISKQRIYIWLTDRRICMLLLRLNLQEKPCMEMKKVWILFSVDVDGSYWGTKMFILFTAFHDNYKNFELMPGNINIETSFHHFTEKNTFFFETKINACLTD